MQFGAVEIDGQWYYFNDSGYLDSGWFEQNGKRYYIDSTGEKAYGAKKIGNTWYYFDEKTGAMHTGWRDAGEKKCYYNDKGELQTMGKSKKKAMHSQKEEQQAKKVMMTMGVIAIVLVIAMFVAYSYWG